MNKTTQDIIEATKIMTQCAIDKKPIIRSITEENQLTQEFINSFNRYFDSEIFTLSYRLTEELVNDNKELFDENLFIENNKNNFSRLSVEMFIKYFIDRVNNENIETLVQMIMESDVEDLNKNNIVKLLDNKIIVQNDRVIDSIALKLKDVSAFKKFIIKMVASGKSISKRVFNILDDSEKLIILNTNNSMDIQSLFRIFSTSEESFINKVLTNSEFEFKYSDEHDSEILLELIHRCSERTILNIAKLFDKMQEWYTYEIGMEILKKIWDTKDIEILKPVLIKSGCGFELVKYRKKYEI